MKAAGENGIPSAFIVGKDGKIAWIGHPMEMDKPLEKIVAGEWDLNAAKSERLEAKAQQKAMVEVFGKLRGLMGDLTKNSKEIVELIDKATSKNPSLGENLSTIKLQALLHGEDHKAASALASDLVDSKFKDNANGLNAVAWMIVDPDAKLDDSHRDLKLALRAAERANELNKGENAAILDTLALAVFLNGDAARALELQEKALKLAPELAKDQGASARLEKYRKAAEKGKLGEDAKK
jgi:hypothetical protein